MVRALIFTVTVIFIVVFSRWFGFWPGSRPLFRHWPVPCHFHRTAFSSGVVGPLGRVLRIGLGAVRLARRRAVGYIAVDVQHFRSVRVR
jgi:hypothetical protein